MSKEISNPNDMESDDSVFDADSDRKLKLGDSEKITNREKEMYRTLRSNLEFSGIENKVVVVTSIVAHDGKSTVSYNLCVALAEAGKKTLYVDSDIRRSVFSERHKVRNDLPGLTHYLSGQKKLEEVVYPSTVEDLYVIPTGEFPSNPTELLGKPRMDTALKELRGIFDYIIIDAAPVGLVIDAAVIARVADASMLVLVPGEARKAEAKAVIEQMKSANPNFLGVVLNKVRHTGGGYYGKGYGYGYYGKGYYNRSYDSYY